MLASGVHPKVVQERLGHSSIAITMDIYSHLMPNMQGEAAAAVDVAMRAAINSRPDPVR
jgi:integrase